MSTNFQLQCCGAMNYLSNSINILVGDGPVPVKFGPKGTDSQYRKDARFTFHTRRAVQSPIADLLVGIISDSLYQVLCSKLYIIKM